jgi:outer membrane biosynthesis protein TonB
MQNQLNINSQPQEPTILPAIFVPVHAEASQTDHIIGLVSSFWSILFHLLLALIIFLISDQFEPTPLSHPENITVDIVPMNIIVPIVTMPEPAKITKELPAQEMQIGVTAAKHVVTQAPKPANSEQQLQNQKQLETYEQQIATRLNKFKPPYLISNAAMMRIRIDHSGQILYYALEHPTNNPMIDAALLKMVERANPLPIPPSNYSQDKVFEFLLPITLKTLN